MKFRLFISFAVVTVCLAAAASVSAAPLDEADVPKPLQPWTQWVLEGKETERCPFLDGDGQARQCTWPATLELDLSKTSGRFHQTWLVHAADWIRLPGDSKVWPQDVRANDRSVVVSNRGGHPSVYLTRGTYALTGTFRWDELPESLQIPQATGLLAFRLNGKTISFPKRDAGRLWLQKLDASTQEESRLEVVVHRRVVDEIPLQLTTRVELRASGKNREVLLAKVFPEGFVPMSLSSPVPARLDTDGRLRVQVRPGTWHISLTARHVGPVESLTLPKPEGPWDADEVWVFDARNNLRLVEVTGVAAVDPQQTTLPDAWKKFPAYRVRAGDTMKLLEKRRGDSDPLPDRLVLDRTWWLDFDGNGYTARDQITGTMSQSWRLEMPEPMTLGRVAVGGVGQFITQLNEGAPAGIEVRTGQVSISADSRLDKPTTLVPAVGWGHDFHQVTGRLNLPPGWRLIHATGVDDVGPTWISRWTLLDLFLVLVLALAVGKLWGWRWGAVAAATFGLIFLEPGAPRWIWLSVLVFEGLVRLLPKGRFRSVVGWARLGVLGLLVILTVPFLIGQVRVGLYPALEHRYQAMRGGGGYGYGDGLVGGADFERNVDGNLLPQQQDESKSSIISGKREAPKRQKAGRLGSANVDFYAPDPQAIVSTGAGVTGWQWNSVSLGWRGPVQGGETVRLFLVPPWLNFVLALLRVLLTALLVVCVLRLPPGWLPPVLANAMKPAGAGASVALLLVALVGLPGAAHAQQTPSDKILTELQQRLLANPECHPNCGSISRMKLDVRSSVLRARLEIHAAADTAVPLPGGARQWVPQTVLIDGRRAPGLVRTTDGKLWLFVPEGRHQVTLEGALAERDNVQVPLPMKPHQVEVSASGWSVDGVHENGLADDNLQLTRIRDAASVANLEGETLPPFVRVERTLRLGLSWQVHTRIVRLTPLGTAVVLEVPLLAGESVTKADVRVEKDKAVVSMGPSTSSYSWTSVLKQTETIALAAPDTVPWTELWRLDVSPIWHVELEGIPVIHAQQTAAPRIREWRPWSGETLTATVTRPEGAPGQTVTLDSSSLVLSPGSRATDATLTLRLRSSRGGQHDLTLPAEADLQSVTINGLAQPIRQDANNVTLPIVPGDQTAVVVWRESRGITGRFGSSEVDLGAPAVNVTTQVAMPTDRWTLLVGGGGNMGPAVLFWSLLVVFLLVALGLGQFKWTPLRWYHWFLLGLGLTQVHIAVVVPIVLWFLWLGWRKERGGTAGPIRFDLGQIGLAVWTVVALGCLAYSIQHGLLGLPEMQITGNGSSAQQLIWYQDRTPGTLPQPWALSVPLWVYRAAMLAWALWLAWMLLKWLRWGWSAFSHDGLWRKPKKKPKATTPPAAAAPPTPATP